MADQAMVAAWLRLVRAEYEELPDLRLTHAEVARLWGIDSSTAGEVLASLMSAGVLRKTARGAYVRSNAG
jgi:DNA-binding IclR family transcriptional regulator